MRILLDTNVLIAAFIAHGTCSELLEHCAVNHTVIISPFILSEFRRNLVRKFGFTAREAESAARLLESRFEQITPGAPRLRICRDPDDDQVISAALAGACDCIVTGDKDLLVLKNVRGVCIITPSQFWENERK
ncbi:MAG: putative toxin-antitoxin system toxin component, PIN family [Candidatus Brocadiia bacterium]